MPLTIRDGTNTPRVIAAIQMRDGTNTPRDLTELWVRDSNNVPRLIWSLAPPMSAVAAPATVSGNTFGTGTATTDATTVTPSGGTPPYTYAWQTVSYDNPTPPDVDSPSSAATTFNQTGIGPGESYSAVFRCLVTDSTPGTPFTAFTNNVAAFWIDVS
jgi:hypothetical protein